MRTSSIERPRTRAVPDVGKISPISSFIVVVFPAPFGPRNPKISPSSTCKRQMVERPAHVFAPEPAGIILRQSRFRSLAYCHGVHYEFFPACQLLVFFSQYGEVVSLLRAHHASREEIARQRRETFRHRVHATEGRVETSARQGTRDHRPPTRDIFLRKFYFSVLALVAAHVQPTTGRRFRHL